MSKIFTTDSSMLYFIILFPFLSSLFCFFLFYTDKTHLLLRTQNRKNKLGALYLSFLSSLSYLWLVLNSRTSEFPCNLKGSSPFCTDSLMGAPSAMVSFYPDVPEEEATKACGEFVFLMDCSGSMESPMNNQKDSQLRIEAAKVKPDSSLFNSAMWRWLGRAGVGPIYSCRFVLHLSNDKNDHSNVSFEIKADIRLWLFVPLGTRLRSGCLVKL